MDKLKECLIKEGSESVTNCHRLARNQFRQTGQQHGRSYSVDNLEAFRQFYLECPHLISDAVARNFVLPAISATASRKSG